MNGSEVDQPVSVGAPALKIATAWLAVGFTSWAEFASFLAACYTGLLIGEWFWKKFWRPALERLGWLKRQRRRATDRDE